MNLFEDRENKEDTTRPAKEKVELFFRWDEIVNMDAAELAVFRNTDLGKSVGLNRNEAVAAGVGVKSGQETSKLIEKMIRKASKLRKQPIDKIPKLPDWTPEEWEIAGRQIRMISRFRGNIGPLEDEDGELTPKAGAMKLWGRDELKATKWPDKDEIKERVKELYQDAREEEHKLKEKQKQKEVEKKKQENRGKKNTLSESLQDKANSFLELLF